jgi:hypothetical protein
MKCYVARKNRHEFRVFYCGSMSDAVKFMGNNPSVTIRQRDIGPVESIMVRVSREARKQLFCDGRITRPASL